MRVYLRYVARAIAPHDLWTAFADLGFVAAVGLVTSEPSGAPIGVAYVDIADPDRALAALRSPEGVNVGGFPARLDEVRSGCGRRTGVPDRRRSQRGDRRQRDRRAHPRLAA
jgi:hypothetical protein